MQKIWNVIHKFQGKNVKQPTKHLNTNEQIISKLPEIANTIANTISCNSCINNIPQLSSNLKLKQNNILLRN